MAYLGLLPPLWTGTICFWCANVSLFNPNILFNAYIVYHKADGLSRGIFKKIRFFLQITVFLAKRGFVKHDFCKNGFRKTGFAKWSFASHKKNAAPENPRIPPCRMAIYFSISPVCSSAVRKYSSSSASLMTVVLPRAYSLSTISFIRATMGSRLSIWRSMSCSWK